MSQWVMRVLVSRAMRPVMKRMISGGQTDELSLPDKQPAERY
ncbi:hypothetical protein [Paramicrobacterium fandaimingii]|nr:hypothetical protein [Microbacterium fandaimingii]